MKFPGLFVFALCLAVGPSGRAADAVSAAGPGPRARAFYAFYLHEINAGGDPLTQRRAEMKKFVSARFLREITRLSKIEDGIEADPFLCAQDWDKAWERHITVRDVKTSGEAADASVRFDGPETGRYTLAVHLAWEAGAWKIDRVERR